MLSVMKINNVLSISFFLKYNAQHSIKLTVFEVSSCLELRCEHSFDGHLYYFSFLMFNLDILNPVKWNGYGGIDIC